MRKYYGVAGTRGYGVYTNWNQAKSARRHTPQYKVKGEKYGCSESTDINFAWSN